ncbi:MAG: hypothetical protein AABZ26_04825, partial [Chloroflexota bacterium]
MTTRSLRIIALLVIAMLVVTACRSEVKTSVGVVGKTITLGEITPLTGPVAVIGKPLTRGHEVYFQYVNEVLGGVGQKLPKEERFK